MENNHINNQNSYKKMSFGEIPNDWDELLLKDIAQVIDGDRSSNYPSGDDIVKEGKLFLSTKNIIDSFFNFNEVRFITEEKFNSIKKGKLKKDDLVITMRGSIGSVARFSGEQFDTALINAQMSIIRPISVNSDYLWSALNSIIMPRYLKKITSGSAQPQLTKKDVEKIPVILPTLPEQKKIASILSTWDKAIELKEKLIEQKKEQKKGLMQKLLTGEVRLPGFDGKWEKVDFEEVFIRIPVKKYQIKTTEYLKSGQFPVIDQGKQKIVAYSNNAEKVYQVESKGVIVFGDHTRERKFIDFDFIVGADGTQVLDTNDGYNNKFYFYCLLHQNIPNTGYNRHFKFLKEMWFFKPSLNEQVKIAEILSKIDKEIDLINKELEELKHQKQGLMQQLLTGKIRVKV